MEQEKTKLKVSIYESTCKICNGKGWYFVNEWIGSLQGRKDCPCKKVLINNQKKQ